MKINFDVPKINRINPAKNNRNVVRNTNNQLSKDTFVKNSVSFGSSGYKKNVKSVDTLIATALKEIENKGRKK